MGFPPQKSQLFQAQLPFSFRQILLVSFLGIILLLGGALARALVAVQTLTKANRDYPGQALKTVENVRLLQDLTVTLERNARQYLILYDPSMRHNLTDILQQARDVEQQLTAMSPGRLGPLADSWQKLALRTLEPVLTPRSNGTASLQDMLVSGFTGLGEINQQIDRTSKDLLNERNQALMSDLEAQRRSLLWIGGSAATLAGLMALVLGMWLSRSLKQLERAIDDLGTRQSDGPIAIGGPTDMRQLGERMEELRLRLMTLEADKMSFLRQISHELKTPLANLREGIALLEDQITGDLNAHQREIIVILRDNALALQQQIETLLQYNSAAFHARLLNRKPTNLLTFLQRLVNTHRLLLQTKNLHADIRGDAIIASIDPEKLETAISNLLTNALRFSPDEGRILLTLRKASGIIQLDCIDSGPGVDPADVQRVFEPFYQGSRQPAGARKGSGVGLSIVKALVEAHGGTVSLIPSNSGAHFRIEIPDDQSSPLPVSGIVQPE